MTDDKVFCTVALHATITSRLVVEFVRDGVKVGQNEFDEAIEVSSALATAIIARSVRAVGEEPEAKAPPITLGVIPQTSPHLL